MLHHRSRNWLAPILVACALIAADARAHVAIVNDGADGAPAILRLRGPIARGDAAAFQAAVEQVRQVDAGAINGVPFITVELDSPGGDVVEALDIGRTIYRNFLMTLVKPGHECVSACVFVLVAGAVHTPADGSSIGLHRPLLVSWRNIDYQEARRRYDGLMSYLREYFRQLGVSEAAYDLMMGTDSYGMRYFSGAEMDRLRLRGEDPAWERFYGAKWAAAAQPKLEERVDIARVALAEPPKLPPVDPSFRSIVFMPGAPRADQDYAAGVDLPNVKTEWAALDNGWRPLWGAADVLGVARVMLAAASQWAGQAWWLIALLAIELLRARPWPGDPRLRRERREQWRLAAMLSPAPTEVSGPA